MFTDGDATVAGGDATGNVLYFNRGVSLMLDTGSGLAASRAYGTATKFGDDRILVAGGLDYSSGLILGSCDAIVQGGITGSRTFATALHFPTGMAFHAATVLLDGRVLFTGGLGAFGQANLAGAYLFTP